MILTKKQIDEHIMTTDELLKFGSQNKGNIQEIIDDDDNIMGDKDTPEMSADADTMASKTTDYNARVHGQHFKNDFLGRFGFYFYESENSDKPKVFEAIAGVVGEENVNAVMEAIKPCLEEVLDEMNVGQVNETKVVEDKITDKKEDKSIKSEKDKPSISPEKLKKLEDVFAKLPKDDIDKIITLLEKFK